MSTSPLAPSVLITGCSEPNSIGDALARAYLRRGYTVFATARNVSSMKALGEAGCHLVQLDVINSQSIANAVTRVSDVTGGRLNILVNNAGVAGRAPLLDTDLALARKMYDVNVFGPLELCQAFSHLLVRAAHDAITGPTTVKDAGRSVIINIGSVVAPMPGMPFNATYAASKAAFHAFSEALRFEMAPLGVKVMLVITGGVRTEMALANKDFNIRLSDPSQSYYGHVWDIYNETVRAENIKRTKASGMAPQAFAEQVVRASLRSNPPRRLYAGFAAWVFRWVVPWLPAFLADVVVKKLARLDLVSYSSKQD